MVQGKAISPVEFVQQHYDKSTRFLFKDFLKLAEDLKEEHDAHFERLRNNVPEEFRPLVDQANYFDDRKMKWVRKRVLDLGNDSLRRSEEDLDKVVMHFNFKKN